MWDLIVSVPDHFLPFYLASGNNWQLPLGYNGRDHNIQYV